MKKQIIACLNALKSFYRYGTTLSINMMLVNYYGNIVRYKHSFKNKETEVVISFVHEWNGEEDITYDEPYIVKYTIPDNVLRGFIFYGMVHKSVKCENISPGTK